MRILFIAGLVIFFSWNNAVAQTDQVPERLTLPDSVKSTINSAVKAEISQFERLLNIIADNSAPAVQKQEAISQAIRLFYSDHNTIEVMSLNKSVARYAIRDYLTRLSLNQYRKVRVLYSQVYQPERFTHAVDGKYYGTFVVAEHFSGLSYEDSSAFNHITRRTFMIVVGAQTLSQADGTPYVRWQPKLGDITVEESVLPAASGSLTQAFNTILHSKPVHPGSNPAKSINSDSTYLSRHIFRNDVLIDSVYNKYQSFDGYQFLKSANFNNTRFNQAASIASSNFGGNVSFGNVFFNEASQIVSNSFKSRCDFRKATFNSTVNILRNKFLQDVVFSEASFSGNADFSETSFSGTIDFSDVTIKDGARLIFSGTHFSDQIDFSNILSIPREIDLTQADLDNEVQRHYISLYDTDVSKIKLDYKHYRLSFYNSRLADQDIVFDWDKLKIKGDMIDLKANDLYTQLRQNRSFRSYMAGVFPA